MKKDEIKFFTKLLNFYDIPFDNGQYIPLNKDKTTHFRKGLEDEWKTVFSAVQIKRAKTKSSATAGNNINRLISINVA